jgi:hypothetical protein
MRRHHSGIALITALVTALSVTLVGVPAAHAQPIATASAPMAQAANVERGLLIPVDEQLEDGSNLRGTLVIERFRNRGGDLLAVGHLNGRVLSEDGPSKRVSERFRVPVDILTSGEQPQGIGVQQVAGCSVLQLDLGPINLDLLGLVVDLSPVELDITAVPGAGNLLGNLLCAVAGLLDPDSGLGGGLLNDLLNGVVRLLNRLLGSVAL